METKENIRVINGNIFNGISDIKTVICHQVNCRGVMGAGIAKQVRNKWPNVYKEYSRYCLQPLSQVSLLGNCQLLCAENNVYVANLFGQADYGTNKVQTSYRMLKSAFLMLLAQLTKNDSFGPDTIIRIPYGIGCGLAGGDWEVVEKIIYEVFDSCNFKVEIWKL